MVIISMNDGVGGEWMELVGIISIREWEEVVGISGRSGQLAVLLTALDTSWGIIIIAHHHLVRFPNCHEFQ